MQRSPQQGCVAVNNYWLTSLVSLVSNLFFSDWSVEPYRGFPDDITDYNTGVIKPPSFTAIIERFNHAHHIILFQLLMYWACVTVVDIILPLNMSFLSRTARYTTTLWWCVWRPLWPDPIKAFRTPAAVPMRSASSWTTCARCWSSTRLSATTQTPCSNLWVRQAC